MRVPRKTRVAVVALLALGLAWHAVGGTITRQQAVGFSTDGPHLGGAATAAGQRRRLLDSASLQVTSGNCTKDFQLGVSYPVGAGFDPSACAGTFTTDTFTYCTSQPQNVAGGSPNAQTTLSLPNSLSPAIVATYVTAYASPDSIFPATYDPNLSVWSTPDGYVCSQGDDGCYRFFWVTQQPVVMQCAGSDTTSSSGGSSTSIGAIVGGVVGGIAAVAAGVALFFFVRRRRQRGAAASKAPSEPDYRIDKIETVDRELGLGKPSAPPGPSPVSTAYAPLGGALGAAAAVGGAAVAGSAASGSESASREADAASKNALSSMTASIPGSPGAANKLSFQSLTSSRGSGATAARIRQLAQDDPILSYIQSKMPGLTATMGSQGSQGLAPSTAGGSGEVGPVRRTSTMAVDARSWEVMFEEIEIIRPIGEGSFGRVYLSRWHHTTVAVKILIDKASIHDNADSSAMMLSQQLQVKLNEEASLLAAMRHPNVVQFYGVCHVPPCMLTEYCSRGSLTDVLARGRRDPARAAELTWRRRLSMALDAALGMLYLHSRTSPIVHRDLKSPNLLVDESWHVKVTDFNLSRLLEDSLGSRSSSMAAMNPRWLAPEVMKGGHATKASDVYSFAIVMWELLTWEIPWSQSSAWLLVQQLMGGARLEIPALEALPGPDKPDPASYDAFVTLMQACWSTEEFARPTFDDISTELRNLIDALPAS